VRGIAIAFLVGLLSTPSLPTLVEPTDAAPIAGVRVPHPGIWIRGDAMFRLGPAVGVLNPLAVGDAADPFVIAGWDITPFADVAGDAYPEVGGIRIAETRAHVVIRDNLLRGHRAPVAAELDPVGHIVAFDAAGISLLNATNVRVEGNDLHGNDVGILVRGGSGASLAGNHFEGNAVNVHVTDHAAPLLEANVVGGGQRGLHLERAPGAMVRGNTLDGIEVAIEVHSSPAARLEANHLRGAAVGIEVKASEGAILEDNRVEGATDGLAVQDSRGARLARNQVLGGQRAIVLDRTEAAVVEGNLVDGAAEGIHVGASPSARLEGNTAKGIAGSGIAVQASDDASLRGNLAEDGLGAGIVVQGGQRVVVEANEGHRNALDGIRVADAPDVLLQGNVATANQAHGLVVATSTGAVLRGGSTFGNGDSGVLLDRVDGGLVEDHLAVGNRLGAGVWVADGQGTVLQRIRGDTTNQAVHIQGGLGHVVRACSAHGNALAGFGARGGAGHRFEDNLATGGGHGVVLDGTQGAVVRSSTFDATGSGGILLLDATGALVEANTLRSVQGTGIAAHGGGGHTIARNDLRGGARGIGMDASPSTGAPSTANHVHSNVLDGNQEGIILDNGKDNVIYNNWVRSSVLNAHDVRKGENQWAISPRTDLGPNILGRPMWSGNWWSDYFGHDRDGDGRGDTQTPYNFNRGANPGDFSPLT
jgi:parallel beta-helix repeat protein